MTEKMQMHEQIYSQEYIRSVVNSIYSLQALRIETGNRIMANLRSKITGEASSSSEKIEDEIGVTLKDLCSDYKKISDFMVNENMTLRKYFKSPQGIIADEVEYTLIDIYITMSEKEDKLTKQLAKILKNYPIYTEFLDGVKGCGTLMSAILVAYLDPYKARHVSSFWRYVGVDVTFVEKDGILVGEGTGLKHSKYNTIEYIDANGEVKTKNGISYNPFVKSKMLGVLATSFIMTGGDGKYCQIYRNVKNRYLNMPTHQNKSLKHIDVRPVAI